MSALESSFISKSLEIGATLVKHLKKTILISLATDLVQQFQTYWQICENQMILGNCMFNKFFVVFGRNSFKRLNFHSMLWRGPANTNRPNSSDILF